MYLTPIKNYCIIKKTGTGSYRFQGSSWTIMGVFIQIRWVMNSYPMKYERDSHEPLLDVLMGFISLKRLRKNFINNKASDKYQFSFKRDAQCDGILNSIFICPRGKVQNPGN